VKGFEAIISAFDRREEIHALDRAATVIGSRGNKDIIKTLVINRMHKIKKIQISGQMDYVREKQDD
jgi:hypothetical protein